jgi:hypothetical protein
MSHAASRVSMNAPPQPKNNTILLGGLEKEVLIDGTKSRSGVPAKTELPFDLESKEASVVQSSKSIDPRTDNQGITSGPRNKVSPRRRSYQT